MILFGMMVYKLWDMGVKGRMWRVIQKMYTVYDRIHARACISLSLLFGPASIRARRLYEPRRLLDANADARVTKF